MAKRHPLTELEKKAWEFAKKAHENVTRKFTGDPYFEHVRKVFKLVKKVDKREILGAAAILHDCVEDVDEITYEIIKSEFGIEVANLVKELTSDKDMLDIMGKPDYLLDKMLTMSDDALIIKLCDRVQNLSDHFSASDRFRKKYYFETKYIIDGLKKNRQLTRPHITVTNHIDGLLKMMVNRYKIQNFESFSSNGIFIENRN